MQQTLGQCQASTTPEQALRGWPARQPQPRAQRCAGRKHAAHVRASAGGSSGGMEVDRRALLLGGAAVCLAPAGALSPALPALADAELNLYEDVAEQFKIAIPAGWEFGEGGLDGNSSFSGATGARRAVGWTKPDDPNTNVVIIITTIGFDYTSMGSFGTAYDFGSNLVGSMDRSYLLRAPASIRKKEPLQIAKLIDTKEIGSSPKSYYVEYYVQRPNGDERHLYSTATLGFNGRYNRLYTVTAQTSEADAGAYGKLLEGVVKGFQPPPLKNLGTGI